MFELLDIVRVKKEYPELNKKQQRLICKKFYGELYGNWSFMG